MQLSRLRRVKLPTAENGKLGTLFVSFIADSSAAQRELIPVTVGKTPKFAKWQIRLEQRPAWKNGVKLRKVELRTATIPLEDIMSEVTKFFGPEKTIIAAQLDLGESRRTWINPAVLQDENFQEIEHFKRGVDVWI